MNPLAQPDLNSLKLLDERMARLRQEMTELETSYGTLPAIRPMPSKELPTDKRYSSLPKVAEAAPKKTIKPQITQEYTESLQYAPDIMSLYDVEAIEPEFADSSSLRLPPKVMQSGAFLSEALLSRAKKLCS
jgi:hypothetical protein